MNSNEIYLNENEYKVIFIKREGKNQNFFEKHRNLFSNDFIKLKRREKVGFFNRVCMDENMESTPERLCIFLNNNKKILQYHDSFFKFSRFYVSEYCGLKRHSRYV